MNDILYCESLGIILFIEMECFNKDCKVVWIVFKWIRVLNWVFMIKFKMLYNLIICIWMYVLYVCICLGW